MAVGRTGEVCSITEGAGETRAYWMTALVELGQPWDSSKAEVVIEMFLSAEVL